MLEFDAINTADIVEFKNWLNERTKAGFIMVAIQIQNGPGLPVKPFTALMQRDDGIMSAFAVAPPSGERGS